ncbi:hypothetical protein Sjap_013287 [Stephania japonica]|uniref:Uncharacterized protein n=1 Tax=Stephania japonica TaxID=461633 RepID=A0AAP0NZQ8_9MAGN
MFGDDVKESKLPEKVLQCCNGFNVSSPIQSHAWPFLLDSRDLIGIAKIGSELSTAREKNGIYIPQDRYLQEEAQKKAMTKKIECMELDSESKDKQLMELQELSNSQQLYTTELSDKLEKTRGELEETKSSLLDLEEKYEQAQTTIKEKEFLISNLLKSDLEGFLNMDCPKPRTLGSSCVGYCLHSLNYSSSPSFSTDCYGRNSRKSGEFENHVLF